MKKLIQDAAIATFEWSAPIIIATTVMIVWEHYGTVAGISALVGYAAAAGLAWRAAWISYKRRSQK